jgi:hypothetical protein
MICSARERQHEHDVHADNSQPRTVGSEAPFCAIVFENIPEVADADS